MKLCLKINVIITRITVLILGNKVVALIYGYPNVGTDEFYCRILYSYTRVLPGNEHIDKSVILNKVYSYEANNNQMIVDNKEFNFFKFFSLFVLLYFNVLPAL